MKITSTPLIVIAMVGIGVADLSWPYWLRALIVAPTLLCGIVGIVLLNVETYRRFSNIRRRGQ